jgi:outer membrane protein
VQACSVRDARARGAAVAALACLIALVLAAPSVARVYTLEECIGIAMSENTSLASAREDLHGARANLLSSWSGVMPRVSGRLGKSHLLNVYGDQLFDLDGDGFDELVKGGSSTSDRTSGSVSISATLLDGSTFARIAGSSRGRTAARLSLESTRREVVYQTKEAYYGLLRAVQLRDVQNEALDLAREQLRKTQSLFDLGSASRSDLLKAQVQVGESELAVIAAEKTAETARAGLALVLGIDVTTDIEAVDPPDEMAESEVTDFDLQEAVSSRPDIQSMEQGLEAAKRSLLAAKAARWPDLSASLSYSRTQDTLGDLLDHPGDEYTRSASLSLSIPIFNGLATKASIDNSKANLRSYEIALRNARLNAAYEIEDARLSAEEGRRSVAVSEEAVMQAEEDLKVSEERFKLRAASMLELIDARVAYSRARADLVNARYDYETAKAELRLALGL